jgi:hypothetical protein
MKVSPDRGTEKSAICDLYGFFTGLGSAVHLALDSPS